ncbi:hypothetical protein CL673_05890 [Candidatus Bathyarchaeota archaeon]|nr:hypothetical protein [Candidatus Bathyarchaeota archaeon]
MNMHSILNPQEWYDLNRFILQLNDSEPPVITLYLPSYEIAAGSKILDEDTDIPGLEDVKGTIALKLNRAKYHSGSICVFGWSKRGESIVKEARISKEVPPLYLVHPKPYVKLLKDILEIGYQIVVIIMDHKKAKIEVYNGSELIEDIVVRSYLKGRHSKGGWSQKRFQQNRELQIGYFFNKVNQQLNGLKTDSIELILLGGRGLAKNKFLAGMESRLVARTRVISGISPDTSKAEITRRVISILDKMRKMNELKLLAGLASPAKHGLVIARNKEIEKKIKEGAVEKLFLAADYYATSPKENSLIKRIIGLAKKKGSTIEFITDATARQRLHKFGNLVALLRYK